MVKIIGSYILLFESEPMEIIEMVFGLPIKYFDLDNYMTKENENVNITKESKI